MGRVPRFFATTLLLLTMAAWSQPQGGGPQDDEVLIPPTTEVLDAQARDALLDVDASGTLSFEATSTFAAALESGDVVVSEPAPAAPYGLLRKVTAVREEGGLILVDTEGAEIRDAVHQGSVSVRYDFAPGDVVDTQVHHAGIEVQAFDLTLDTDFGTGGLVQATGSVTIDPRLEFDVGIGCDSKTFGICDEWPDLNVHTLVGVEQSADLRIEGEAATTWDERFVLATQTFSAQTYFIGPVPIVIVPRLILYLDAEGELTATVGYRVDQDLTLAVGFDYNSDSGFDDLSERTASFSESGTQFTGSADIGAYAGAQFELLLYGVIGPFGSMDAGPHFEASATGLDGATLLWRFEGCLRGHVGIDSVDVLDIRYDAQLFDLCTRFGSDDNSAPIAAIQSPNEGSLVYETIPLTLRSLAVDPDGQEVTCRWTSSVAADPFPVDGCEAPVTFLALGARTLTLTVTDPVGASSSDSVAVDVLPEPEILVTIVEPVDGGSLQYGGPITLTGVASGGTAPYEYTWTLTWPTDASGEGTAAPIELGQGATYVWTNPAATLDLQCEISAYALIELTVVDANGTTGVGRTLQQVVYIC